MVETDDGSLGGQPCFSGLYLRTEIDWAEVVKIQVYFDHYIEGLKFLNNQNKVVQVFGDCEDYY